MPIAQDNCKNPGTSSNGKCSKMTAEHTKFIWKGRRCVGRHKTKAASKDHAVRRVHALGARTDVSAWLMRWQCFLPVEITLTFGAVFSTYHKFGKGRSIGSRPCHERAFSLQRQARIWLIKDPWMQRLHNGPLPLPLNLTE